MTSPHPFLHCTSRLSKSFTTSGDGRAVTGVVVQQYRGVFVSQTLNMHCTHWRRNR